MNSQPLGTSRNSISSSPQKINPLIQDQIQVPQIDPVKEFLRGKTYKNRKPSVFNTNIVSSENVHEFSSRKNWKGVIELCKKSFHITGLLPHVLKKYRTAHMQAHLHLGQPASVKDHLNELSGLSIHTYENYADYEWVTPKYDGKSGSLIPFSMFLIQAYISATFDKKGDSKGSIEQLYSLLMLICHMIKEKDENAETLLPVTGELPDNLKKIKPYETPNLEQLFIRQERVAYFIINVHLKVGDNLLALQFLERMSAYYEKRESAKKTAIMYGIMARIYMQVGMVEAAEEIIERIEKEFVYEMEEENNDDDEIATEESLSHTNYVRLLKGYIQFCYQDYEKAYESFQVVLKASPLNYIAACNCAIVLLYQQKLQEAINLLEDFIRIDPGLTLNETVIYNICKLYSLQSGNGHDMLKKRTIQLMVQQYTGEDYPLEFYSLK